MITETSFDDKQKKLNFFQNLVLVAIADRYVDEMESDFLVTVGDQLELTPEDTNYIVDNLHNLSFVVPEDGRQKHLELQTLVMMVLQDGEVEEREYNLCLEYTYKIGYSKELLDNLIKQIA